MAIAASKTRMQLTLARCVAQAHGIDRQLIDTGSEDSGMRRL
jgi:hypothetical protein